MEYNATVNKILDILKMNNCWHETFEHEPVRTSEEAASIRPGYTQHQGAKAMIVRVKISETDKRFIMLVLPGDMRFNNSKVKELLKAKDVRFATEAEVSDITNGILPGGVPPFGNLFNLEVLVDPSVIENEKIVFNAGDRRFTVAMLAKDYQKLVLPRIENIV